MLNFVVLIQRLCDIYGWLIVIWCILSWVPRTGSGLFEDVRAAIATLVEPYPPPVCARQGGSAII